LFAVRAVEFEFGCVHKLHSHHAQTGPKRYIEYLFILFDGLMRM